MSTPDFFVGVDGGATRTRVLVLDAEGTEQARRTSPGVLVRAAEPTANVAAITAAVQDALRHAGAEPPAAALCCALAGAGRSAEREAVQHALLQRGIAGIVHVVGDVDAALHDAFGEGPGLLVIAGTGSIALGRGEDGTEVRVGGWGQQFGDEGSGYAIGIAALRAVGRAHDQRGDATALTDGVLRYADVTGPAALIAWVDHADKARIAGLAPLVLDAAASDDAAERIILDAAHELASHIRTLHRRLEPWNEPPHLALAGGILDTASPLRRALIQELQHAGPDIRPVERIIDAARGAAHIAVSLAS